MNIKETVTSGQLRELRVRALVSPTACTNFFRNGLLMDYRRADGMVLVVVLLATLLVSALAAALVATSSSEVMIAANFRRALEALHAADGAAERAMGDLAPLAEWDSVLGGTVRSTFVDGPPFGARVLPDGSMVDPSQVGNLVNCRKVTPCSPAEMDAVTAERPWGANNPRWQPYAHGRLTDVLPNPVEGSPYYAVVLIGADPSKNAGDLERAGGESGQAGVGAVALRAEVFGPRGTYKVVELTIARSGPGRLRVVSWRAVP